LVIAPIAGWGMFTNFATANTILQTITEDDMRGRVMSFFSMAFVGMAPFGTLLAGFAAKHLTPAGGTLYAGARRTFVVVGIIVLIAAISFIRKLPMLRAAIRPIYQAKGILPQVAEGLQAADMLSESGEE
jgi:MFS family permease